MRLLAAAALAQGPAALHAQPIRRAPPAAPITRPIPSAEAAATPLAGFAHTAWTVTDGAPADIWTLALSPTGFLWLGTGMGLYRFDGVRFERYALRSDQRLPSSNINALLPLDNGDVWLGLYAGGVLRLREGVATRFGPAEGLPDGRVLRLARTADGALWAAAEQGLARFDGQRWQRIGTEWQYTERGADYVFVDRRGVLWVAGTQGLWFLPPGAQALRPTGLALSRAAVLAEDRDGRLWLADPVSGVRPLPDLLRAPASVVTPAPASASTPRTATARCIQAKQLLFAADGSLWLTEAGRGVHRLPAARSVGTGQCLTPEVPGLATVSQRDGLPSDVVVPLVQASEGEVWVGSNFGLASFREQRLHALPLATRQQQLGYLLAAHGSGVVAGTAEQLSLFDPPAAPRPLPAPPPGLRFLARGADGALWLTDPKGVIRQHAGRQQRVVVPGRARYAIRAIAPDARGGLWLSVIGAGVFHVADPATAASDDLPAERVPDVEATGTQPTTIAAHPDGSSWFGYDDAVRVRAPDGAVRALGPAQGLAVGRSTALLFGRRHVYIAGEAGLARFDGRRFQPLRAERPEVFQHISGMVEHSDGTLWLNGARGVVQVRAAEVDALFDGPAARHEYRLFDWNDGLPGIALQAPVVPSVLADERGRLWFATNRGVAWLDPAHLPLNARPPRVELRALRAGETDHPAPQAGLVLPEGTRSITVRYSALTLAAAERARFRYRLVGVDREWQDAGTRREATYANLRDGDYRFEVMAANGDGVWNPQPTQLPFSIAPTLVQTRAFAIACVALLAALAWGAYRLRARTLVARLRLRLEERHAERERIARDLHDTLLQSTQGLILGVQGIASQLPAEQPARRQIEALLDRADAVVLEARERVRDLRHADTDPAELLRLLEAEGQALAAMPLMADGEPDASASASPTPPPVFRVVSTGTQRPLARALSDELHCLAREALANAFRHARARQVEVELSFGRDSLCLRVRDDGVGIPADVLAAAGREGHWGLTGMRERAQRFGGRLRISSAPGGGTEIEARFAAGVAYRVESAARQDRADGRAPTNESAGQNIERAERP